MKKMSCQMNAKQKNVMQLAGVMSAAALAILFNHTNSSHKHQQALTQQTERGRRQFK